MLCAEIFQLLLDQQKPKMNSPFPENTFCLFRDGSHWVAARLKFENLQVSKAGYGENPLFAMRNLLQEETPPQQGINFAAHGLAIQYNQEPAGTERTVLQSDSHGTAIADLRRVIAARDDTIEYYRQKCAHQEKRINQLEAIETNPPAQDNDEHPSFQKIDGYIKLLEERNELVERIKEAHAELDRVLTPRDVTHASLKDRCSNARELLEDFCKRTGHLERELKWAKHDRTIRRGLAD